jgi:hypothetical protein
MVASAQPPQRPLASASPDQCIDHHNNHLLLTASPSQHADDDLYSDQICLFSICIFIFVFLSFQNASKAFL